MPRRNVTDKKTNTRTVLAVGDKKIITNDLTLTCHEKLSTYAYAPIRPTRDADVSDQT
jgi:hypothetical protein